MNEQPQEPVGTAEPAHARFDPGAALVGIVFVVLGAVFLLDTVDAVDVRRDIVWPAVLIALGAAVIVSAVWRRR